MSNTNQEIDILVNDKPIRKINHEGKTYIQANKGEFFSIRVRNNSPNRILAVFSVDSVNPINGEVGSEAGYVISGNDSLNLKGWRTSDDSVNAFRFSDVDKSYSVKNPKIKSSKNVGVLGVQIYSEKIAQINLEEIYKKDFNKPKPSPWPSFPFRPWYDDWDYYPYNRPYRPNYPIITWDSHSTTKAEIVDGKLWGQELRCANNSMNSSLGGNINAAQGIMNCSFSVETPSDSHFNAGTEFSDKEIIDRVKEVAFQRGPLIREFEVFYAWKEDLLRMGVPLIKETKVNFPEAFPKKYCVKPE